MLYAIRCEDAPASLGPRARARSAHLERLRALQDAGRLILAGACPAVDGEEPGAAGFTGALVVAEFDSLDEATAWARDDPYVDAGAYAAVTVSPFTLEESAG